MTNRWKLGSKKKMIEGGRDCHVNRTITLIQAGTLKYAFVTLITLHTRAAYYWQLPSKYVSLLLTTSNGWG